MNNTLLRAKISTLTRIHKGYEAELLGDLEPSERLLKEMLRREARKLLNQLLQELYNFNTTTTTTPTK